MKVKSKEVIKVGFYRMDPTSEHYEQSFQLTSWFSIVELQNWFGSESTIKRKNNTNDIKVSLVTSIF
jgi:hypothetical protein